jgi:hypothetical protein
MPEQTGETASKGLSRRSSSPFLKIVATGFLVRIGNDRVRTWTKKFGRAFPRSPKSAMLTRSLPVWRVTLSPGLGNSWYGSVMDLEALDSGIGY